MSRQRATRGPGDERTRTKWHKTNYLDVAPDHELEGGRLKGIPSGHDPREHRPLRIRDFVDPADYWDLLARRRKDEAVSLFAQAMQAEQKAEDLRRLGPVGQRKILREAEELELRARQLRERASVPSSQPPIDGAEGPR